MSLMTKRIRERIAFALDISEEKVVISVADKDDLYTALAKNSKYSREQVKYRIHAALYDTGVKSFKKKLKRRK